MTIVGNIFFSSRVGLFTARFLLFLQKKMGKKEKNSMTINNLVFSWKKEQFFLAARFARNFPSQIILTKSCVRKCSLSGIKGKMTII